MMRTKILLLAIVPFLAVGCGSNSTSATPVTTTTNSSSEATSGGTLVLTASTSTVGEGGTVQFTASGGSGAYSYINLSGVGTLNTSTGAYTAPSFAGAVTVEVTDTDNDTPAEATVTIVASGSSTGSSSGGLTVTPSLSAIASGGTVTFTVSGGTAPYSYYRFQGDGSLSIVGTSNSSSTVYTATSSEVDTAEIEVIDSSYPTQIGYGTVSVTAGGSTSTCSSAPVLLLSAEYSNTKGITSYFSTYGGTCELGANPDKNDTVTCTGMTNVPSISSYYYTCTGAMKMYDIMVNGVDSFGYYAGLPQGECNGSYTSVSVPVTAAISQLQIDARSGQQVVIYGVPSCD